jgi:hypothetical protein
MNTQNRINRKSLIVLNTLALAACVIASSGAYAQTASSDFKAEPDKTMAAAHESFVKGDMKKAGDQVQMAATYVGKESDKVVDASKADVKKAGVELDKFGDGIKKGAVKSGDDIKKCAASTDHTLAKAWHQTAEAAKKSGKDPTAALKKAGAALESASKWSGHQLSEGAKASVDAVSKAGKGVAKGAKASADEVDKWFKGIGDGIKDLGLKF